MAEQMPTGVSKSTKKDGTVYYRASITVKGKHISLGSFPLLASASKAYEEARNLLDQPQASIDSYSPKSLLAFEKWVSLINLRDNGIYFANPIYIRPKMFYYYLSTNEILKFDAEDLFFYSSHKIQKRGGHLFVSHFGSQITLGSRYGIKPHGLEGRDYRFINGDSYDYRSQNLEILNPYHGVEIIYRKGRPQYKSRIHINGYYLIGIYKTPVEAALAYNKGVDLLKKIGISKKYPVNEIEQLTPKEYAALYHTISLSKNFLEFIASHKLEKN